MVCTNFIRFVQNSSWVVCELSVSSCRQLLGGLRAVGFFLQTAVGWSACRRLLPADSSWVVCMPSASSCRQQLGGLRGKDRVSLVEKIFFWLRKLILPLSVVLRQILRVCARLSAALRPAAGFVWEKEEADGCVRKYDCFIVLSRQVSLLCCFSCFSFSLFQFLISIFIFCLPSCLLLL